MTMAQVQGAVALVVALILSWAGLLMAIALSLPVQTDKARQALEGAPKRCFLHGLGLLVVLIVTFLALQVPVPLVKLAAVLVLLALGAVLVLGAAGLAHLMGQRIGEMSGAKTSFGMLARGALLFGGAALFPLIGWYLFAPLAAISALGAGANALWPERGTMPNSRRPASTPDFDLAGR